MPKGRSGLRLFVSVLSVPYVMLEVVRIAFDAELWIWDARRGDTWVFVSVPAHASQEIRDVTDGPRRGFGSVRVAAAIGGSSWRTSIFPDKSRATYVLPIKRAVRVAEGLDAGDVVTVQLELVDP